MFAIEPNTVYSAKELSEITGYSRVTIYKWFKTGLKNRNGMATGHAVLEYFEPEEKENLVNYDLIRKAMR